VVVVHESRQLRNSRDIDDQLIHSITAAVSLHHDLTIDVVVFIRPGQMPMTTSGKLQRGRCRQFYVDQSWRVVRTWHRHENNSMASPTQPAIPRKRRPSADVVGEIDFNATSIETWLLQRIAQENSAIACPANPNALFATLGLDSLRIVAIARDLEKKLQQPFSDAAVRVSDTAKACRIFKCG
jgi:acyl carrier protein